MTLAVRVSCNPSELVLLRHRQLGGSRRTILNKRHQMKIKRKKARHLCRAPAVAILCCPASAGRYDRRRIGASDQPSDEDNARETHHCLGRYAPAGFMNSVVHDVPSNSLAPAAPLLLCFMRNHWSGSLPLSDCVRNRKKGRISAAITRNPDPTIRR
ncbi:hypothetical protein [Mesorhizobium xinjiangense]|uniref:hypothetical protein n=1 Tax=Mesorhizobium xinjiangense TaxID=2678685 RepID=UPI0012EDFA58|nr:hypothetical protein [Mesorhizobium xinjiangense]